MAAFLTLPSSNIEEISQNFCIFDAVKCQVQELMKSCRVSSFSSLQLDR